jgi:hypothetical protein
MVTNTQKSFLRFALVGGVLALSLTGCGDSSYENFEECELKEMQKLSQKSADLSDGALGVITNFCVKYPLRSEQEEKQKSTAKIADPKWIIVGPEKGYRDGTRSFIDVNNVETDGFEKTFWVRVLKKGQTIEGKNFGIRKKRVDCSSGAMTNLLSGEYVNGNGSGKEEFQSVPIVPGGSNAAIYRYVCEKK